MILGEITNAVELEIAPLRTNEIVRYLSVLKNDLTKVANKQIKYRFSIIPPTFQIDDIYIIPADPADEKEIYSGINSFRIPTNIQLSSVWINNNKLKSTSLERIYEGTRDSSGLPKCYTDSIRVYLSTAVPDDGNIFIIGRQIMGSVPVIYDDSTIISIPDNMLQYVVFSIASSYFAKQGNWSKAGFYKNMKIEEQIKLRNLNRITITDNWGGGRL